MIDAHSPTAYQLPTILSSFQQFVASDPSVDWVSLFLLKPFFSALNKPPIHSERRCNMDSGQLSDDQISSSQATTSSRLMVHRRMETCQGKNISAQHLADDLNLLIGSVL